MANHKHLHGSEPLAQLRVELVPSRSAAWRELWRRLFAVIEVDLLAPTSNHVAAEGSGGRTPSSPDAVKSTRSPNAD